MLELPLSMSFEGKDRLGKLVPVYACGDHREADPAVDVHQRRRLALGPERACCQYPDLPFAGNAEGQIFGSATHAVHGNCKSQQLGRGSAELVSNPRQQALVPAPVPG